MNTEKPADKQFTSSIEHVEYLGFGVDDTETLRKFKDIFKNMYEFKQHDSIISFIKIFGLYRK